MTIYRWVGSGLATSWALYIATLMTSHTLDTRFRYTLPTLLVLATAVLLLIGIAVAVHKLSPQLARLWLTELASARRDGWDPPPTGCRVTPEDPTEDATDLATATYLKDAAELFELARQVERERLDPPDGELAR